MKPTELMIGDWVFNKHHKKHIQITPYDFFNHAHLPSGKQYFVGEPEVVSGRDFEPIPLTHEILERNGFKYFEDCNSYILLTEDLDSVILTLNGLTVIFHWHDIPIMCVHQLQHVLRLCGLNELADNFKLED